eukprot:COSAG06_NODE_543_length_14467_cov_228.481487_8_plen_81_part_00
MPRISVRNATFVLFLFSRRMRSSRLGGVSADVSCWCGVRVYPAFHESKGDRRRSGSCVVRALHQPSGRPWMGTTMHVAVE